MSDDFAILAQSEHMFFGLDEPYLWIRTEVERMLRAQVPDTEVESIVAFGEPKFRTLGRKTDDDPNKIVVTAFAICFRATITAKGPEATEALSSAFTACFKGLGGTGERTSRTWLDLHQDADTAHDDEKFEERFLEFRYT